MFELNRYKKPAGILLSAFLLIPVLNQCAGSFTDENFWSVPYAYNEFINGAPGISVTSPADGDTNVSTNQTFIIAFNKVVNSALVTMQAAEGPCTDSIQLSADDFATCVGGTLFTSDNQLFGFVASSVLTGEQVYKLRVTDGITDLGGNKMHGTYTMANGFTTSANLLVNSQSPAAAATNVTVNSTSITLNFSKFMDTSRLFLQTADGACVDASTIRVSKDNFATCLGGSLNTGGNPAIIITLPSALDENSTYQVRVTQNARDTSDSGLQAEYTGAFTTFAPSSVGSGNLRVWLKADGQSFTDLGITAAGNGDFIQQWNDSSGNNNHGTQTTALKNPVLVTNQPAINNKPVVRFDGTLAPNDDVLDLTTFTNNVTASGFSVLAVVKFDQIVVGNTVVGQYDGGGTGRNLMYFLNGCGGNPRMTTNFGGVDTCGSVNIAAGTWYIAATTFDTGNVTTYTNGNAGTPAARTGENATGNWRIGSSKLNVLPMDGDIAEVIIYSVSLSGPERQTMECYLSYKYGITITGHTCP